MSKHDFVNEDVKQRAEERCECGEETRGHASDANMADGGDAKADKMAGKADSSSEPEIEAATPQQEAADDKAAEVSAEELVEQWRDKYLRLQAEFDNYRKRTLREKMDLVSSGGADVLKSSRFWTTCSVPLPRRRRARTLRPCARVSVLWRRSSRRRCGRRALSRSRPWARSSTPTSTRP